MGLFQQMREAPERARAGTFMAAFFEEAPIGIVDAMHNSVGRDALGFGLQKMGDKSGCDPGEMMQILLKKAMEGDALAERTARKTLIFAAHWWASNMMLELMRAAVAVFREIQSRKYVLDDSFDPEATFKKAIGA